MKIHKLPLGLILASLLMFCCSIASAQNFRSGTITTLEGEILAGEIAFSGQTPTKISFRKNGVVNYEAGELQAFQVGSKLYESARIQLEISPWEKGEFDDSKAPKLRETSAFVLKLIGEEKALYLYKDEEKKAHFYIKNAGGWELLIYKEYRDPADGGETKENKQFHKQLYLYLRECPNIQFLIPEVLYEQNSLIYLFEDFQKCLEKEADEDQTGRATSVMRVEVGLLAGGMMAILDLASDNRDYYGPANAELSTSIRPFGGAFVDLAFPLGRQRIAFHNEVGLGNYRVSGEARRDFTNDIQWLYENYVSVTYLKTAHTAKYIFEGKRKAGFYVHTGLSLGFLVADSTYTNFIRLINEPQLVEEGPMIAEPQKLELGFVGGLGLRIKQWDLEARYEYSSGPTLNSALQSTVHRAYVLLGYRF
ncbi:MAG: hypothetical protein AAFR61_29725 [Bacteroidota bacterium]